MRAREIVLANIDHTGAPRCGMNFGDGRINDFLSCGLDLVGYEQRRWRKGKLEYYDDEWGNLWVRMRDGSVKGEVCKPAAGRCFTILLFPTWRRMRFKK